MRKKNFVQHLWKVLETLKCSTWRPLYKTLHIDDYVHSWQLTPFVIPLDNFLQFFKNPGLFPLLLLIICFSSSLKAHLSSPYLFFPLSLLFVLLPRRCLGFSCHCVLALFAVMKGVFTHLLSMCYWFLYNYVRGVCAFLVIVFLFSLHLWRGYLLFSYHLFLFFVQLWRRHLCLFCYHVFFWV